MNSLRRILLTMVSQIIAAAALVLVIAFFTMCWFSYQLVAGRENKQTANMSTYQKERWGNAERASHGGTMKYYLNEKGLIDAPKDTGNAETGTFAVVTAYTCNDGDKSPGDLGYCLTAPDPKTGKGYLLSNKDAQKVVAADPKYYPFGTKLYLDGVGVVTVRDTGSAIKGPHRIDLFVGEENIAEAITWGAQRRFIVLKEEKK